VQPWLAYTYLKGTLSWTDKWRENILIWNQIERQTRAEPPWWETLRNDRGIPPEWSHDDWIWIFYLVVCVPAVNQLFTASPLQPVRLFLQVMCLCALRSLSRRLFNHFKIGFNQFVKINSSYMINERWHFSYGIISTYFSPFFLLPTVSQFLVSPIFVRTAYGWVRVCVEDCTFSRQVCFS